MPINLNLIDDLINGKLQNIPDLRKKVVRIFISSTFTDTTAERDYLIEKIYPKLKEHCKLKYDLDFQTVDMRWGIQSYAYEYHGTTELCLNEIGNCAKYSLGPSFVTLIGQKYGLRPLPRGIEYEEFEILKNELLLKNEDLSLSFIIKNEKNENETIYYIDNIINKCFRLDTNSIPNKYRLLPISKIVQDYNSVDPKKNEYSRLFWDMIRNRLSEILRKSAESAFKKNIIDSIKKDRYFVSITEKEIFKGIYKVKDPNRSSLCFIRDIENLEENLTDSSASRFIDLNTNPDKSVVIDYEAKELLDNLKYVKIPSKLNPGTNIFHYKVKWNKNEIDPDDLKKYLNSFGERFFKEIVRLIDEAFKLEEVNNKIAQDAYRKLGLITSVSDELSSYENDIIKEFEDLTIELGSHANEYNQSISKFFGRENLMTKIKNYILGDSQMPFVITGESGCGKSSFMAMTHKDIPTWVKDPQNYSIITRFLGTTVQTSSIYKSYLSIALQLHYLMNLLTQENNFKNYEKYCGCRDLNSLTEFILYELNQIKKIDPNRKIVLILDSLDQLTPNDYSEVNKWLFTQLPHHVKFIVSTIPNHGNLLSLITNLITKKCSKKLKLNGFDDTNEAAFKNMVQHHVDSNLLEVNELSPDQSEKILNQWLISSNNCLTSEQWNDLRKVFNSGKLLPLFLKLMYNVIVNLHSYDSLDEDFLNCLKIDDIIIYMFHRMERLHGEVTFRRAISYMTVCKNGISDNELEDVLSLDDDVLYSVFQFHMPPIRRLPTILWIRIKKDLQEYIVEKEANDTKVIYWHHRRFIEVAQKKYVESISNAEIETIFQNILDFYNETWKDKQKPFELNEYLKKKMKNTTIKQADRFISSQPIEYRTQDGTIRYNKRKLAELPSCLSNMSSHLANQTATNLVLRKACELVYFNYEFMHAKFVCDPINDILDDLKKLINQSESLNFKVDDDRKILLEIKMFRNLLGLCGQIISDNPDCLAFQITSRLTAYYGQIKYLTHLIDECDRLGPNHCALVSPHMQLQPPGGFLISSLQKHRKQIYKLIFLGKYFITISRDKINLSIINTDEIKANSLKIKHAFDVLLPSYNELSQLFQFKKNNQNFNVESLGRNNKEISKTEAKFKHMEYNFKCIVDPDTIGSHGYSDEVDNPDLFPALFLVITKYFVYIIAASREIKFFYECVDTKSQSLEILDAFSVGSKQIIIVEKNANHFKIFPNIESQPTKYNEYQVSESSIIKQVSSTSSQYLYDTPTFTLDIVVLLESQVVRQFYFKHSSYENDNFKTDDLDSDIDIYDNDHEDIVFNPENVNIINETEESLGLTNFVKMNKTIINNLQINLSNLIRPMGLNVVSCLKSYVEDNMYYRPGLFPKIGRVYLSCNDGTLVILKSDKNQTTCCVFRNMTKQPIIQIKKGMMMSRNQRTMFRGSMITKDYVYLFHTIRKDNKYGLCKIELKEKADSVQILDDSFFVICREGIIELYKTICMKNTHKIRLLLTLNSNSKKVTDMIIMDGGIMLCCTNVGTLNTYSIITGKRNEKVFPAFDRTFNSILKIYTSLSTGLSISKNNELVIWDITTGKITRSIDVEESIGFLKKLKFNTKNNFMVALMSQGYLLFYKDFSVCQKLKINADSNAQLLIINDVKSVHINPNQEKTIKLIDLYNLRLFKINLKDGVNLSNVQIHQVDITNRDKSLKSLNIKKGQNLIVFISKLEIILLIDKLLETYSVIFQESKTNSRKISNIILNNKIRYLNSKVEKEIKKFFDLNGKADFKYRVFYEKNFEIYFSISALKKIKQPQQKSDEKRKVLNRLVVNARLLSTMNRKSDNNIELEIVDAYSFCKNFIFKMNSNNLESYLCIYQRVELDENLAINKSEYATAELNENFLRKNKISIIKNKKKDVIFELSLKLNEVKLKKMCIDNKIEYLSFFDENRLLWLYRISDCVKLACLPLYGSLFDMNFSENGEYICLGMDDRRIFSLLVVDPIKEDHKNRIKELPSRQKIENRSKTGDPGKKSGRPKTREEVNKKDMLKLMGSSENSYSSDGFGSTDQEISKEEELEYQKQQMDRRKAKLKTVNSKEEENDTSDDDEEEDENFSEKAKQKMFHIKKKIEIPVEFKLEKAYLQKPNWLVDLLEKFDSANNLNGGQKQSKKSKATLKGLSINEDIFERFNEVSEAEKIQSLKLIDEMKSTINSNNNNKNNTPQVEPNLVNSGKKVKIANGSSKACLIS